MTLRPDTYFLLPNYTTNFPAYCFVEFQSLTVNDTDLVKDINMQG